MEFREARDVLLAELRHVSQRSYSSVAWSQH